MDRRVYVYLDHELVSAHPEGTHHAARPDGGLTLTEPDGAIAEYDDGQWHGAVEGPDLCAFVEASDACPRCARGRGDA